MNAPDLASRPAGSRPGERSRPGMRPANYRGRAGSEPMFRADLPASRSAPRQARATVRHALIAWGLSALSPDAELITSELVANAAEHGGTPIRLTIRRQTEPDGLRGMTVSPHGKTAWFTLTAAPERVRSQRQPGFEAEPGA